MMIDSVWISRDGKRSLTILDTTAWRGEQLFTVRYSTGRSGQLTESGLKRKYYRAGEQLL